MREIEDSIKHFPYLKYENSILHINNVSTLDLAENVGAPFFLYLPNRFEQNYNQLKSYWIKVLIRGCIQNCYKNTIKLTKMYGNR